MEQQRMSATERIGSAERPKVLLIEIPSDSQFRFMGGIESPEHYSPLRDIYKLLRGGREFVAFALRFSAKTYDFATFLA
jgi:hypothetical protein